MANPRDPTPNCFSSLLHRLLCSGSVPTHPSDHLNNSINTINFKFPEKQSQTETNTKPQTSESPGIVARLMGLDSLPQNTNWVPKQTTLESILRSRSVNFIDYLPQFDQTQKIEHRRVRTSVSFREDPAFFRQENHDFLVLCFEKPINKNNGGIGVYERETEKGFEGKKVKNREKSKKEENRSERAVLRKKSDCAVKKDKPNKAYGKTSSNVGNVHGIDPSANSKSRSTPEKLISTKQVPGQSSQRKKKKNQSSAKNVVPESLSENPIQVVEVHDCRINIEASKSDSGLMGLDSKAKSSSKTVNLDYPSPNLIRNSTMVDDQQPRTVKNKAKKPLKTRETDQYYIELSTKICRLTEEDQERSNWVAMDLFKFEGFEEICIEFGNQILNQLVDELVGLHFMQNLAQ